MPTSSKRGNDLFLFIHANWLCECRQCLGHGNVTLCSCSKRPQRLEDCRTVSPWLFLGAGLMSVLAQQRTGLGRLQRLERGPILHNTCTRGAEAPGNRRSLRLYMEGLVCSEWNKKPACNTQHISQLPVNPRKEKREAQCHHGQLGGCKFQQCSSTDDTRKWWRNIAIIENCNLVFHTSRCEQLTFAKVHPSYSFKKPKGHQNMDGHDPEVSRKVKDIIINMLQVFWQRLARKKKQSWNFPLEMSEALKLLIHNVMAAFKIGELDLRQQADFRVTHHWDKRG